MDPAGLEPATTRVLSDGTLICASSVLVELEGVAPSLPQCHCGVLLLNYSPSVCSSRWRRGAVPWNRPRISGFSIRRFSHQAQTACVAAPTGLEPVISSRNRPASIPTRTAKSLAERVGIEPIVLDRQSSGSPAAVHAPWCCGVLRCCSLGYLSRIELELPESQTGVQATTQEGPWGWWEGETASGHRPS